MKKENPAFILHTGDLVKDGRNSKEWDRYLRSTPAWPAVVPVRGNHDRGGLFETRMAVETPVHYFHWGPVLFLGLDTEIEEGGLEQQLRAAETILKREKAAWRVVYLHRPIWSRGHHGSDERRWNEKLVPLFDRYKVDLVLAGHDHNYERFCASKGLGTDRECVPEDGRIYIVTGGGATFTNHFPGLARDVDEAVAQKDRETSLIFSGSRHFVMVDATVSKLELKVHRTRTGNLRPAAVIDNLVIHRDHQCDGPSQ
jgi:predicted phosphodiesterase